MALLMLGFSNIQAQDVTVKEPEFAEETLLLTGDDSAVKLTRENAVIKTKAGASLYLTKDQSRSQPLSDRYRQSEVQAHTERHDFDKQS